MSDIRKCFKSRFGGFGVIMEADYSQLEVIALAFLSGDRQLKGDIRAGVDIHLENAAALFNKPRTLVTPEERKKAKQMSFQLQYGAGYKSMAKKLELPEEVTKKFIEVYYARYPDVQEWQNATSRTIQATRERSSKRTNKGIPAGRAKYSSITGREYTFYEHDAPDWMADKGTLTSFSPTEMKNYPVQGFATGDIVPMMLGRVFRRLQTIDSLKERCLMINTVHDSIVFDCHKDIVNGAKIIIKEEMEKAPMYLKEMFDIDFDLPMKVDIKYGDSWMEC